MKKEGKLSIIISTGNPKQRRSIARKIVQTQCKYTTQIDRNLMKKQWRRFECRIATNKATKVKGYTQTSVTVDLIKKIKQLGLDPLDLKSGDKSTVINRLVTIAYKGDPPSDKYQSSHLCNNPLCCNHRHLIWETSTDNQLRKNCKKWRTILINGKKTLLDVCIHDPPCIDFTFIKTKEDLILYKNSIKAHVLN